MLLSKLVVSLTFVFEEDFFGDNFFGVVSPLDISNASGSLISLRLGEDVQLLKLSLSLSFSPNVVHIAGDRDDPLESISSSRSSGLTNPSLMFPVGIIVVGALEPFETECEGLVSLEDAGDFINLFFIDIVADLILDLESLDLVLDFLGTFSISLMTTGLAIWLPFTRFFLSDIFSAIS